MSERRPRLRLPVPPITSDEGQATDPMLGWPFAPPESGETFVTYTCPCGTVETTWDGWLRHRRDRHEANAERLRLLRSGDS